MQIDFYSGEKDAVLILTGLGGDIKGYENKYVKMAETMRAESGVSVFVAGIPSDCWNRPKEVFDEAVSAVLNKIHCDKIYVFGNSAGANLALYYSYLYPQIKRITAVNPVLNLNIDRTRSGISGFQGERLTLAVGELDSSVNFLPFVPKNDKLHVITVAGADHHFSGKLDDFIMLGTSFFENPI